MNDWKEYELGELLDYEQPTSFIVESTNYDDKYDIPVLTAGKSFILGYTNEQTGVYDKLPVIIFDDFTTASRYINFPFKVKSSAMKILTANTDIVLPKYIYYRMQIIQFDHSTHKRYWIQQYSKIKIAVPPLEEQRRIVARIEELFSQLDDAEATLQKTKAQLALYRQAVYASAYKGMTADHSIVEYFEIAGGITKNATRSSLRLKRPYLRVANVYYNRLDLSDIKEIGITKAEVEKCTLAKNDLLFVEGNGSQSQIGRVAIWDGSIPDIVHQNHIIKGRPNGSMLPEFALFYLISAEGRKQITEVAKSTSGLYTLSTDKVRKLKIPYCSIEAQRDIIDEIDERLSMCDSIEETMLKVLTQITATKQAILKQAFQN